MTETFTAMLPSTEHTSTAFLTVLLQPRQGSLLFTAIQHATGRLSAWTTTILNGISYFLLSEKLVFLS